MSPEYGGRRRRAHFTGGVLRSRAPMVLVKAAAVVEQPVVVVVAVVQAVVTLSETVALVVAVVEQLALVVAVVQAVVVASVVITVVASVVVTAVACVPVSAVLLVEFWYGSPAKAIKRFAQYAFSIPRCFNTAIASNSDWSAAVPFDPARVEHVTDTSFWSSVADDGSIV